MCAAQGRVATDRAVCPGVRAQRAWSACDGEKMSKSKGNLVFVSALRAAGVDPMAIRLALLAHHYRDDWEWSDELLVSAQGRLSRWREAVRLDAGLNADEVLVQVRAALAQDLDAPVRAGRRGRLGWGVDGDRQRRRRGASPGRPSLRGPPRRGALAPADRVSVSEPAIAL